MYNDLLTIGPITIHGYGFMIGLGAFLAVLLGAKRAKTKNLNPDTVYSLAIVCLLFGFIGAKVLYCIVEFKTIMLDPMSIFSGSGFVVYGGIIGGVIAAIVYCKLKKIRFLDYFDLLIPSVALAQGFGRVGCFLAGCCYGRETDSIVGIAFQNSSLAPNGVKLIPTQLFSSVCCFLIAIILIIFAKNEKSRGKVGALYLIMYSIGRFIIEFFRNDFRGSIGGVLSTSQFISIFILLLGMILFFVKNPHDVKKKT